MEKRILVENYGCQMNDAEIRSLLSRLLQAGWTEAAPGEAASVVLLNTCSVRKTAENRIWGRLGYYKKQKEDQDFLLVVMGCMTQRLGREIRRNFPAVDVLIGTFGKTDFVQALLEDRVRPGENFMGQGEYHFAPDYAPGKSAKALIPIMHGCNNFCSYCIVPHVRGREVSRDPGEILRELQEMENQGVREVTLLGQNVNSYSYKTNDPSGGLLDFPGLLKQLLRETHLPWFRFISCHPKDLSPELIKTMAANPRICRHLHLPVQHGSDKILEKMNRKYTKGHYLKLVKDLREAVPGISLTTDILIGFPGESPQDFQETLELLQLVGFEDAYMYYYNPIEGTPAFSMENPIPEKEKKDRLGKLIALQHELARERKKAAIGGTARVLVEGVSRRVSGEVLARSEQNHMVVFAGSESLVGRLCQVKILSLKGNTFVGELLSDRV